MIWNTGKPEFFFFDVDNISFLVKLTDGGIIKASRSNRHWFGLWRWLQDEEVEGWTVLYR